MKIVQSSNTINIHGYIDRLERGFTIKHEHTNYEHVKEPLLIQKPKIEDFNNLVIVRDTMEVYC